MASCSSSDQIFIMPTSSSYTIKGSGSFSSCNTHSQWHKLPSCKASRLNLVTPRFPFSVASRTKYPLKPGIWMQHGLPSLVSQKISGLCPATKGDGEELILEPSYEIPQLSFLDKHPTVATGFLFFEWSILNAIFNVLNKKIYFYFPYPFFMSVVQLTVGGIYSVVCWTLRTPKRAPLTKELIHLLLPLSFCHAFGHMMTNVSFSTVAVSFTHTIKALEPFFNAAASHFFLSSPVPLTVWLSLVPVVLGVVLASVTEVSFNWKGFLSAILSNVAYTYRNIYSKQAMKGVDSTNLYYYITLLSLILCIPPAIVIEGPALMQHGLPNVIASVGYKKFLYDLLVAGLFYHLYQQIGNNTLERVSPLSHAVGNVLKRVVVITFSILVFGNRITLQTGVGTTIAITGVALYSYLNAQKEAQKVKLLQSIKGTTE